MTCHVCRKCKESMKKLLKLMREFRKVAEYKVSIKGLTAFLYTRNSQLEIEIFNFCL